MYFSLFLHFYQPPTQYPEVLKRIARESYIPILEFLEEHPQSKITANFSGSLTEQLAKEGFQEILDRYGRLVLSGQLELVGSAAYHPILPKILKEEIRRQVLVNERINEHYFGSAWSYQESKGFFPPEIAYSSAVGEVISELGYRWVLLSEASFPVEDIPDDRLYRLKGLPLIGFFRDKDLSLKTAFGKVKSHDDFLRLLDNYLEKREYIIAAMDAETFGHHLSYGCQVLAAVFKDEVRIKFTLISELLELFGKKRETIAALEATWGTTLEDRRKGNLYPRWDLDGNPLHSMEWELIELAISAVSNSKYATEQPEVLLPLVGSTEDGDSSPVGKCRQWQEARLLLDKSLSSDLFWWSSHNPHWHPGLVKEGLKSLLRVVQLVPDIAPEEAQRAAYLSGEILRIGIALYGDQVIGGLPAA